MSEMEIQRKFFEEKTGGMFDTLAAAKKACEGPHVRRVWLQDGKIIGKCTLYIYGKSVCSVKTADKELEWTLTPYRYR